MRKGYIVLFFTVLVAVAALLFSIPGFSYLPEYGTRNVLAHWNSAPTWRINPATNGNVLGGGDPTSVIAASFNAWKTAPNVGAAVAGVNQGSNSNATAHNQNDNVNLICFTCSSNDFGSGGDTLAITYTSYDSGSGQIVDADLLFNPADDFLTNGASCPSGKTCAELQTVATHEIGHFFGLDHSGVTSAVMYPFAPEVQLQLGTDDVAGISKTYPGNQTTATGTITGKITGSNGAGLCGIHVFADSNSLGSGYPGPIRKTPVGAMTLADGTYTIAGVPPGAYTVTAEPLDGPVDSGNVPDYAKDTCGSSTLSTGFTSRQF